MTLTCQEDALQYLEENGYDIVSDELSYVFKGVWGSLDHASDSLVNQVTGTATWVINAEESKAYDYDTSFKKDSVAGLYSDDPYRASDHNPVLIGLNLGEEQVSNMIGTPNDDNLLGTDDNDVIAGTSGNDVVDGGLGSDTMDYSLETAPVNVILYGQQATGASINEDRLISIENIIGTALGDTVLGNDEHYQWRWWWRCRCRWRWWPNLWRSRQWPVPAWAVMTYWWRRG